PEDHDARTRELLRAALRLGLAGAALCLLVLVAGVVLRPGRRRRGAGDEDGVPAEDLEADRLEAALLAVDESTPRGRVVAEYLRLQRALERTRSHRRPHQTPLEHARAVTRRRAEALEPFQGLHRVLYRLVYGGEPVDGEQAEAAARSCRRLRRLLG
ncbi:MAG: DUF4129 domain-containing protein, partial [Planctomycetes bacterium]|nr:DUF4129 domain-containing protein [Planctomycetota bacterium]